MAAAAQAPPDQSSIQNFTQGGAAPQSTGDDPTYDSPKKGTSEQDEAAQQLDDRVKAALLELRKTFKLRYQPKRMRFISEAMRAFEALRGNTYALLNDQSAALDTINQLMTGFLGQGDDPQLYAHNDNIYQAFAMIFIAALMVDLGKVRYQPADAQDDQDLTIARKGSTIQAYIERSNKIMSLQQVQLLYLWLTGSYFCYTRYVIDEKRSGTSPQPQYGMKPTKIKPDGYICPQCGKETEETAAMAFQGHPQCPNCGANLQGHWFEGPELDLPVKIGEIEVANGMTAYTILNGLQVDINPDCLEDPIRETEILDYTIPTSAAKIRSAYPDDYAKINASMTSDGSSDGDMARTGQQLMTTPGSNNRAITTQDQISFSRCWIDPVAFAELEDQDLCKELRKRYPKGCKLVVCGDETYLECRPEAKEDRWTWCGTVKGIGSYPFAAGKVVLDVQERVTGAVNKIDAYMDRVAYGTMLYDADYIDGTAMKNKVLTPGNLTGVSRTDEETGERVPLAELFHQMTFTIDNEIYKYPDTLTTRAQFLAGVMPQVFGGSDKHVETAAGQEQALNTALGRLKQYLNQMQIENAERAVLGVRCSIDNMDEEVKIVEAGESEGSWKTIRLLKAELSGNFFAYPEEDAGFPATYAEIQTRLMALLAQNQKMPIVAQMLADPKIQRVLAQYLLPPQIKIPLDAQLSKIETVLHRLSQDPNGAIQKPNPANPLAPPITVPSILPESNVDDPAICAAEAKAWCLSNWEQAETNPVGYGNVLAYLTVSGQLAREQAAAATLATAAQAQQGAKSGAGSGQPGQPGS